MVIMDQCLDLWARRVTVKADREELNMLDLILFFASSFTDVYGQFRSHLAHLFLQINRCHCVGINKC